MKLSAQMSAVTHNEAIDSIHARADTGFYTQYGSAIEAKNIPAVIISPVEERRSWWASKNQMKVIIHINLYTVVKYACLRLPMYSR